MRGHQIRSAGKVGVEFWSRSISTMIFSLDHIKQIKAKLGVVSPRTFFAFILRHLDAICLGYFLLIYGSLYI